MLSRQRKQTILALLAQEKQVQSRDLSQRFGLSEDSIRRDLRELAAEGLLQRVHGGALPVSAALATFETRKNVQTASKQVIAQKAISLIQPGQIVLIDGGTTSAELVRQLPAALSFTAITHSPSVALALADHPLVEIIMVGGQLYKHSVVTVGASMLESINRINADLFFMGVTGVHPAAGLLDNASPEARIVAEAEEETGFRVSHVQKVFEAFMSPGSVTEKLYFFIAEYDDQHRSGEGGGIAEEGEDIEVLALDFDQALQAIDQGRIVDAKTIMLLQHLRLKGIL